jgi:hypothetical protein
VYYLSPVYHLAAEKETAMVMVAVLGLLESKAMDLVLKMDPLETVYLKKDKKNSPLTYCYRIILRIKND